MSVLNFSPDRQAHSPTPCDSKVTETWPEYLRRIASGLTQAEIASRVGVGRLSVNNWLHGKTRPKAETVIDVARAFQCSPIEAMLAASYLTPDELNGPAEIRISLRHVEPHELASEVSRRLTAQDAPPPGSVTDG